MLGVVPATLLVVLYLAYIPQQYLVAYIPPQLQSAPVFILYPLVVLAALISLVVPHLRRRYAGGLWTAVLLNPIVVLVVWGAAFMLSGGGE
jgi:predicted Abi (CAAX) family protease